MILVEEENLERIDSYLSNKLNISRSKIQKLIKEDNILVNGEVPKTNYKVKLNDKIEVLEKEQEEITDIKPTNIPLDIVYEDDYLMIINKKSGLVTHPAPGHYDDTLVNAVLYYLNKGPTTNIIPGIVHRLDKDTSGVVLLAKDEETKNMLQDGWNSNAHRSYVAVVHGKLKNKSDRCIQYLKETKTNLVYVSKDGLEAITNYNVVKENDKYTLVAIDIETGRRNQIRVLFNSMGNPIVGDKKYFIKKDNEKRLYLHANRLQVYYPHKKEVMLFETKTPIEFKNIMK